MARPMMTLEINAEDTLCEFNLIKISNDESEARKYAIENGVDMLES